jgi:laccase
MRCCGIFILMHDADTFRLKVIPGQTYLLRIINAALNDELFFAIANHTVTVVEADALYVKPFQTEAILISPGQTTNVLLKAKSTPPPLNARFLMAARPYVTGGGSFDNSTTAGILEYAQVSNSSSPALIFKPTLPALNDTSFATKFSQKLRSLATPQFPAAVPQSIDKHFLFTVGLGLNPCPKGKKCQGPSGTKLAASINNISFVLPSTALLQAHYFGQSKGVYKLNFPDNPPFQFNYTGTPPNNTRTLSDTRLKVVSFNVTIQVVLQDTSLVVPESHPLHLHGYDFFVVGRGTGNYNSCTDPKDFNLVDPPQGNTVGVPSGGWVALRFRADNPGNVIGINPIDSNLAILIKLFSS